MQSSLMSYKQLLEDKERNDTGISKYWDYVRRDLDWFRKHNAEAYMTLLD